MAAIKNVPSTTDLHEESEYQFLNELNRNRGKKGQRMCQARCIYAITLKLSQQKMALCSCWSVRLMEVSTFYIDKAEKSLYDKLRERNSTRDFSLIEKQPLDMGFFFPHFRKNCPVTMSVGDPPCCEAAATLRLGVEVKTCIKSNYENLSICISGQTVDDDTFITT